MTNVEKLHLKKVKLTKTYIEKMRKKLDSNPTIFDLLEINGFSTDHPELLLDKLQSYQISAGHIWESTLASFMKFTKQRLLNCTAMDYDDGTDAKFATANPPQTTYATVGGHVNKTGTLRVCVCSPKDNHRLHFLLIPYEVHSQWKSPLKLNFSPDTGKPSGIVWEKYVQYKCNFSQVCSDLSLTQI